MATKAKNPKSSDKILLNTIQRLLKQKEVVDKQLLKVQKKLVRQLSSQKVTGNRKTYVRRMNNKTTLKKALRKSLIPNQEMTMQEILVSLSTTGAYKTRSSYIYTMVNNKLNRDSQIKKVHRGIFMFVPRKRSSTSKKSNTRKTASAAA